MILPTTAVAVWILAIVSLLCLGSWANTLKLAGRWRFEYFYYDFVLGILLSAGVAVLVLGSGRPQELTFQDNLLLTGYRKMAWVLGSGVVLNLGTLLLLAAIGLAGMSVAFPLTLGVAVVVGTLWDFAFGTQSNTLLTLLGVALLVAAVIVTALAYVRLLEVRRQAAQQALTPDPRVKSKRPKPTGGPLTIAFSVAGGIILGAFPRILAEGTSGDNGLAPYPAILLLSVAALLSSPFFVLFFTTFPLQDVPGSPTGYLSGTRKQHLLGVAGGIMWAIGILTFLLVQAAPQIAQPSSLVLYILNNAALLVAAAWGLLAWREFQGGDERVGMLAAGMVVLFLTGLGMVAFALLPK